MLAHLVSSIWTIDRTLSDATILGQSELRRNGNEGVLNSLAIGWFDIISTIHIRESYPSAEIQSVLSTAPAIAHLVCSIWTIDRTLSGATIPGQSELGSNGNEGVLHCLAIRWFDIISTIHIRGSYPSV